ncbi:heterogeneous nuclear ribonucleoprotein 27C [Galendromus occidentalis]|uniref:Heterogeneous nuclear ribonucleoprotein 27C n=1 Tax=Galendromus occidentalis TaxID=34638 RepID=A0AAJ6QQS8_9ACAR|nr:heterogeneous nuclear ribonucleoprotein 27C [Galendromus occidentalis]
MVDDKDVLSKMFVGGLSWDTTKEGLQSYFCRFGEIVDCVVMTNEQGRSRGFGFVTFKDPQVVQVVCQGGPHRIDNRVVDPKPCNPRGGPGKGGGKRGRGYPKIFVGGLPTSLTENELKMFFQEHYGDVFEVVIMYDQERRKSRGFGFVSFENDDAVDRACRDHYVSINGKQVECKRAQPRDVLESKMGSSQGGLRAPTGDFYGYGNPGPRGPPQGPPGDFRNGSFGGWGAPAQDGPPTYSGGYGAPQTAPSGAWGGHPGAAPPHTGWSSSQAPTSYNPSYGGPGPTAPTGTAGYGGYAAPAGNYGPPSGPAPGPAPPAPAYGGYGAPGGPAPAPPNGYNGMGGSYGQDASSYGPTRGAYDTYGSAYSTTTAPGTERANGAPMAPPGAAGSYHPYRR